MRFFAVLLLISPVLARDSDRQRDSVSPYIPIVVENPEGRPETIVGLLDTRRGRLVWDRTIGRNPFRIATLSAYGNAILVGIESGNGDPGVTVGLKLKSGEILFEHPGTVGAYIQVNHQRGIVLHHPQGLTCFDAETGQIIWLWKGKQCGYIPTVWHQRLVAGLDSDGGVAVLDGNSGAELWRRQKASDEILVNGPAGLWVLRGNEVVELDLDSGKEGRSFKFALPMRTAGADSRFVYLLFPRYLQALDVKTLQPAWRWDSYSDTSYLFTTPHGILVKTEGDTRIHLLNPESGKGTASLQVPESNGSGSTFTRDCLYVHYSYKANQTPQYTIIDAQRGGVLWMGEAEGFIGMRGGMSGHAWSTDKMWHVDLRLQEVTWKTTLPGKISDAMMHSGRLLVVAGQEVMAMNPLSGDLLWRWASSSTSKKVLLGYWVVQ
jgi:outer membrane protein assembly factor BamB